MAQIDVRGDVTRIVSEHLDGGDFEEDAEFRELFPDDDKFEAVIAALNEEFGVELDAHPAYRVSQAISHIDTHMRVRALAGADETEERPEE